MNFSKGDRVTVTNPNPGNARFRGRTGTVTDDGSKSGLMAVKGIDGRLAEAVKGTPGFYPEELSPAR
ncbi:hypothetical protein AB0G60_02750 [Streptomyces angustmyceticus]|uniref:KOW domain-containing protein n=1 Tax=Streptomyces angustmyceticus TaxID=285578 RepID=A0A5J4LB80_9ACTN|nr:hypothetical protein [Streptomyces angustmyceticus]UAL65582.1 hypothetical protein K7396_02725 [Streptomyces angustmyceticus]GES27898.1 hypothetical protein San01_03850 [Streptomyces angustmyceticus]